MGLAAGYFFGLTTPQVKALRSVKGDPLRRQYIDDLKRSHDAEWILPVGEAWCFLQHLLDPQSYPEMPAGHYLCHGRSLHKGLFYRIELLNEDTLSPIVQVMRRLDEPALRELFFGMNEERFRYRWVPFWVAEEWEREGRKTVLTDEQFDLIWKAINQLPTFLMSTVQASRQVVFACNFKDGPY